MKSNPSSSVSPKTEEEVRVLGWWPLLGFLVAIGMMLVPLPIEGRAGAAISDIAHAPIFGFTTIALLFLWHRWKPLDAFGRDWTGRIALIAAWVFLAGVVIEFAQMMTGRTASMHDVVANGLGIVAAVALSFALLNWRFYSDRKWLSVLATGIAVFLLGLALAQPVRVGLDVFSVSNAFPMIASFETDLELTRWHFDDCRGQATDQNVTHGDHGMRILADRAPHPAATLIETVSDWSDVETLELDATLARSYPIALEFIVKVIDQNHTDYDTDTARKTFWLQPGQTTHLVFTRDELVDGPDTRKLDLARIQFVSLLLVTPKMATFIDVDWIHVTTR